MKLLLMEYKKIDESIIKLMKSGIKFCFSIILIACLILLTYDFAYGSPFVYELGIALFKAGSFFITSFIICAFAFNKIMKDLKE